MKSFRFKHYPTVSEVEVNSKNKTSWWGILLSTLAAAIGVQSNKNRERDFKHGNIKIFIAAGIIFTTIFVVTLVVVVKQVLNSAGA